MRNLHIPGRSNVLAHNGIAATSNPLSSLEAISILKKGTGHCSASWNRKRPNWTRTVGRHLWTRTSRIKNLAPWAVLPLIKMATSPRAPQREE